ncbi:BON domain-containing protein [Phenylobacterium sp. J367]|uniref:BON domain-containing protein n=1 Tax=Phenylobacterium sp. J367 TaxID=2898435 RepID=UPI00215183F2|nr:BON domain-containing protein [Phenylobacterium sp. J367]MCR5879813.1 BON domain-containing protein [Phenylobacterium sp. J367]
MIQRKAPGGRPAHAHRAKAAWEAAMDDATLTPAALAVLEGSGFAERVHAKMASGIVTLCGSAPDQAASRSLEGRLLALPGVLDVHNYLDIGCPDEGLEARLRAALAREGFEAPGLRMTAEHGVVTLSGEAGSWSERDACGRLAWRLPGVREIINRIDLPPGEARQGPERSPAPA